MEKVSVIIPVYNSEEYLSKCIESILNQSHTNLEIICVDDCSKDNSFNILNDYKKQDDRIQVYKNEANSGVCATRNNGCKLATGEYIYFIDSDDWIDKDYIEKMYKCFGEADVDFVVSNNINSVTEDKETIYNHPGADKLIKEAVFNPQEHIDDVLWVVWNRLFKASFLKKINFEFPVKHMSIAEDLYMQYVTFAMSDKAYYTEGSTYHYLQRQESRMHNVEEGIYHIRAFDALIDYFKAHELMQKNIKIYKTMPYYNITNEEIYAEYRDCFLKLKEHIDMHEGMYNPLDKFFVKSVIETKSYDDYISKYSSNATISFMKNRGK